MNALDMNKFNELVIEENNIKKLKLDENIYKTIELQNGVKIFYICDKQITHSKVILTVNAGSYNNPKDKGIAHLLEHTLFLGNEQYREPFVELIKKYNIIYNATTDLHTTSYYFETMSNIFEKILEIFVYFFINPLFNRENIKREIKIVDDEHNKNINKVEWITFELMKSFCITKYNSFTTGNINTLGNNFENTYEELLKYFNKYYFGKNMTVFIIHNELELNKNIIKTFEKIKSDTEFKIKNVILNRFENDKMEKLTYGTQKSTDMNVVNFYFKIDKYFDNNIDILLFEYFLSHKIFLDIIRKNKKINNFNYMFYNNGYDIFIFNFILNDDSNDDIIINIYETIIKYINYIKTVETIDDIYEKLITNKKKNMIINCNNVDINTYNLYSKNLNFTDYVIYPFNEENKFNREIFNKTLDLFINNKPKIITNSKNLRNYINNNVFYNVNYNVEIFNMKTNKKIFNINTNNLKFEMEVDNLLYYKLNSDCNKFGLIPIENQHHKIYQDSKSFTKYIFFSYIYMKILLNSDNTYNINIELLLKCLEYIYLKKTQNFNEKIIWKYLNNNIYVECYSYIDKNILKILDNIFNFKNNWITEKIFEKQKINLVKKYKNMSFNYIDVNLPVNNVATLEKITYKTFGKFIYHFNYIGNVYGIISNVDMIDFNNYIDKHINYKKNTNTISKFDVKPLINGNNSVNNISIVMKLPTINKYNLMYYLINTIVYPILTNIFFIIFRTKYSISYTINMSIDYHSYDNIIHPYLKFSIITNIKNVKMLTSLVDEVIKEVYKNIKNYDIITLKNNLNIFDIKNNAQKYIFYKKIMNDGNNIFIENIDKLLLLIQSLNKHMILKYIKQFMINKNKKVIVN